MVNVWCVRAGFGTTLSTTLSTLAQQPVRDKRAPVECGKLQKTITMNRLSHSMSIQ